ncbi:ADP-ribosylglycohydrolase family protein [Plantactinospora sonchi]|uniref:ADP-ribosylglycohydrolase family protein n=1 Tax=Plantactinospora sonchi TaxID=1544735 RepID=A0ABU7RUM6_9ACTN
MGEYSTATEDLGLRRRWDRIAGGLLGVHAGDSLGATAEFMSWSEIRERYPDGIREIVGGGKLNWPAGQATDDTDLMRAVVLAYLDPGDDVVRAAADHMVKWWVGEWPGREPGSRPHDFGGATMTGLRRYQQMEDPRRAGAGSGQAGNGSLMRCLPTALVVSDQERRIRESMEISAITHDDARCTISCAAYNEIAAALLADASPDQAVTVGREVADRLGGNEVADAIAYGRRLQPAEAVRTGETYLANGGRGYVLDSLSLGVAALLDPRPLPDVVIDIAHLGGDTDTNAAIAGGLLGIRDGVSAIPERWRSKLQFGEEFLAAADAFSGRSS